MGFNDVIDWYLLVLEQVANWKITVLIGDSFFYGSFSTAMWNYQKIPEGNHGHSHINTGVMRRQTDTNIIYMSHNLLLMGRLKRNLGVSRWHNGIYMDIQPTCMGLNITVWIVEDKPVINQCSLSSPIKDPQWIDPIQNLGFYGGTVSDIIREGMI